MTTENTNQHVNVPAVLLIKLRWLLLLALLTLLLWVGLLSKQFNEFTQASAVVRADLDADIAGLRKSLILTRRTQHKLQSRYFGTVETVQGLEESLVQAVANSSISLNELRNSHGKQLHDLYTELGELQIKLAASDERNEAALTAAASDLELRLLLAEATYLKQQGLLTEHKAKFEQIMLVLAAVHQKAKSAGYPERPHAFCDSEDTMCGNTPSKSSGQVVDGR